MTVRVLVARLDSDGDVVLAGPAVRAIAAGYEGTPTQVFLLCSPAGEQAAYLLPDVSDVIQWRCPWIDLNPEQVRGGDIRSLIRRIAELRPAVAVLLTSFHQSPLPLALLLRLAGVRKIAAISTDYPGSLLDVRLRPGVDFDDDLPEPERALCVARAAGFDLPPGDSGGLAITTPPTMSRLVGEDRYVVVHPGSSAPSRAWPPQRCREAVEELAARGHSVVVTGASREKELTAQVAGEAGTDLGGMTTFAELAGVLSGAESVVVGNTGPAHLAAAVGTPVVSLFAPVVPASRWAPYGVPHIVLGDQEAECRGSRARVCPVPGHPCLSSVTAAEVVAAVESFAEVSVA